MLRMVSVAAAGILLAAPASAAVMQVVFTGEEIYRSYDYQNWSYDNGTWIDNGSFNESGDEHAGTAVTWVLRYDYGPDTVSSWSTEIDGATSKGEQVSMNAAFPFSKLTWNDRTFQPLSREEKEGNIFTENSSIDNRHSFDSDPGDEYSNGTYNSYSANSDQSLLEGDGSQRLRLDTQLYSMTDLFTPFGLGTEFSIIPDSNITTYGFLDFQSYKAFYDGDIFLGYTQISETLKWNITSLTVTYWDDGTIDPPVSPVPLPATAPLLLAALGGAWALRRRRHA